MNVLHKHSLLAMFLFFFLTPAFAVQISYPTDSYSSGDTLTASGLNTKFNEIKSAVNTNDNKTTLDSLSCSSGQVAKWNGLLWVCADVTSPQSYTASFVAGSFVPSVGSFASDQSVLMLNAHQGYWYATAVGKQYLIHPLELPNGAQITATSCYYYDNDATNELSIYHAIFQQSINTTASATPYFAAPVTTTSGSSTSIQSTPGSSSSLTIDNTSNYYMLYIYFSTIGPTSDLRFTGCKVTYNL